MAFEFVRIEEASRGPGYWSPHYGRPDEVGGSAPRGGADNPVGSQKRAKNEDGASVITKEMVGAPKLLDYGWENIDAQRVWQKERQAAIIERSGCTPEQVAKFALDWGASSQIDAIQRGAEAEFGSARSPWQLSRYESGAFRYGNEATTEELQTARKILRAVYDETQSRLGNTEYVTLYRAMGETQAIGRERSMREYATQVGDTLDYMGNAVESWTYPPAMAASFLSPRFFGNRVILRARVPREKILSFPSVGMGEASQAEVLVLGRISPIPAVVKRTRIKR